MSDSPDDPRSDPQLIEAINAGDRDAFEALYRRHRDWAVSGDRRAVLFGLIGFALTWPSGWPQA